MVYHLPAAIRKRKNSPTDHDFLIRGHHEGLVRFWISEREPYPDKKFGTFRFIPWHFFEKFQLVGFQRVFQFGDQVLQFGDQVLFLRE